MTDGLFANFIKNQLVIFLVPSSHHLQVTSHDAFGGADAHDVGAGGIALEVDVGDGAAVAGGVFHQFALEGIDLHALDAEGGGDGGLVAGGVGYERYGGFQKGAHSGVGAVGGLGVAQKEVQRLRPVAVIDRVVDVAFVVAARAHVAGIVDALLQAVADKRLIVCRGGADNARRGVVAPRHHYGVIRLGVGNKLPIQCHIVVCSAPHRQITWCPTPLNGIDIFHCVSRNDEKDCRKTSLNSIIGNY